MMVLFLLVFLSYFHITYSAQSVLGECEFKHDGNAVPCHPLVQFMYTILEAHHAHIGSSQTFVNGRIWNGYDRETGRGDLAESMAVKGEYICNTIIKNKIDEINTGSGLVVHPNCQWQPENTNNQCVGHVQPDDIKTILKWDDLCAYRWHQKQRNGNIDEICDQCDNDNIGGIQICEFVLDPNIPQIIQRRQEKFNNIQSEIGTERAINQFYNYLECYNRNGFDKFVGWDEGHVRAYQGKYGYTKSGTQYGQRPYFDDDLQTIQSIRFAERQQPAAAASASKGRPQPAASASKGGIGFGEFAEEEEPIIHQMNRRNKFDKDVVLGMIGQFKVFYHTYKGRKDTKRCTTFRIGNGWFCTSGHCPTATTFSSSKMPRGGLVLRNSIGQMFYRDGRGDYMLQELCVPMGFMTFGADSRKGALYDFALFRIDQPEVPGMAIGFHDDAYFKNPETVLFAAGYPGEGLGAEAELRPHTQISIGPFSFADALNRENLDRYQGAIEGELVQDRILQDVTREGEEGESGAPLFGYDRAQNVVYGIVTGPAIYDIATGSATAPKDIGQTFFRFTKQVFFQIQQHCDLELVDLRATTPDFHMPADLTPVDIEQNHMASGDMDENAMEEFLQYITGSFSTQIYQQLKPGDNTVGVTKYVNRYILPLAKKHMQDIAIFERFKVSIEKWKTRNQFRPIWRPSFKSSPPYTQFKRKVVHPFDKIVVESCVASLVKKIKPKAKVHREHEEKIAIAAIDDVVHNHLRTKEEIRECLAVTYDKCSKIKWAGHTISAKFKHKILTKLAEDKGRIELEIGSRNSGRIDQDNLYYYDTNKMYPKLEESLIRQEMLEIRKAKQQKQRKRDYFFY